MDDSLVFFLPFKGPFTLGGIPAVSARRGTLPSTCCIYIRRETGGKLLASCKWVFTGNRISCIVIFTFAKRRRRWQRSANGVSGYTIHYTENRNVGEFCILVPELWGLRLLLRIFRICQYFTSAVCAYSIDISKSLPKRSGAVPLAYRSRTARVPLAYRSSVTQK